MVKRYIVTLKQAKEIDNFNMEMLKMVIGFEEDVFKQIEQYTVILDCYWSTMEEIKKMVVYLEGKPYADNSSCINEIADLKEDLKTVADNHLKIFLKRNQLHTFKQDVKGLKDKYNKIRH